MKLTLGSIAIKDVSFGTATEIKSGVLYINKEELITLLKQDEHIARVEVELARPGDRTRIMPVKDVIEPRVKVEGPGSMFPGMLGKVEMVGSGRTHVLQGAAVVTCGKIIGFQEGIIDMSGPGADYSPFGRTNNVVLIIDPVAGLPPHDHEAAVRLAGLKAAAYLGEAGRNAEPERVREYEFLPLPQALVRYPELPKVVYVYMLQTQGLLHDTWVYGVDAKRILPTLMAPTEVMDGAIVSGNCVSACDKNTTYFHQNNPVIHDLYERHGRDFNFIGMIITNEKVTLTDKERSSAYTARLVEYLNPDGAIITAEGFGNPDTDLMMNCIKISRQGVKTVLITDEFAGRDGASQSLADAAPEAEAVVSTGNANEVVTLPAMEKIIGYPETAEVIAGGFSGSLTVGGSITIEIQALIGSTCELGFGYLSAREY